MGWHDVVWLHSAMTMLSRGCGERWQWKHSRNNTTSRQWSVRRSNRIGHICDHAVVGEWGASATVNLMALVQLTTVRWTNRWRHAVRCRSIKPPTHRAAHCLLFSSHSPVPPSLVVYAKIGHSHPRTGVPWHRLSASRTSAPQSQDICSVLGQSHFMTWNFIFGHGLCRSKK